MTLEEESIMKKIAVLILAPVLALAAATAPAFAQTSLSPYSQDKTIETAPAPAPMATPNRQMQPGSMSGQMQHPMMPMAGSSGGTQRPTTSIPY